MYPKHLLEDMKKSLTEAGIKPIQAEAIALSIHNAAARLENETVTREILSLTLEAMEARIGSKFAAVDAKFAEINALIAETKNSVSLSAANLETSISKSANGLIVKFAGMLTGFLTIVILLAKFTTAFQFG